jgi:hypothetical protein
MAARCDTADARHSQNVFRFLFPVVPASVDPDSVVVFSVNIEGP